MKLAVLIPTRGDRPVLLANCIRMMLAQTRPADYIELVNDPPLSSEKDITWRYRIGYDRLRNRGFDLIAFIEDDDYYHPTYLETMLKGWQQHGSPFLFGTSYTIYYHLRMLKYYQMTHYTRSSAMGTLIRPDEAFDWCPDSEVYTDMHLWNNTPKYLPRHTFTPDKHICLGIKHGVGLSGGFGHSTKLSRFTQDDQDKSFLRSVCDPESFEFYSSYFEKHPA